MLTGALSTQVAWIKGYSLIQITRAQQELFGEDFLRQVTESLSPEFREALATRLIVPSGWYPVTWPGELHRVAFQLLPQQSNVPEQISRRAVENDMRGVYGFLARFASPEFLLNQSERVLKTYLRGPRVEARLLSSGHAEVRYSDCHGFNRFFWRAVAEASVCMVEKSGAKNARARFVEGGGDGDVQAHTALRWE